MFKSKEGFELAKLLYRKAQVSGGDVDTFLDLCIRTGGQLLFSTHKELYAAIDQLTVGDVPWQSFTVQYTSSTDANTSRPKWMSDVHEVFYRDPHLIVREMLANPSFKNGMDFGPYHAFDQEGSRRYEHLMSGDWAWNQAVRFLT